MTHTDIQTQGWIARLPEKIRPYALLMRLDRPIGTWLLLLPGWWSILLAAGGAARLNTHDLTLLALFGAGAVIMRGAGCAVNDLWDRKLDREVERTRNRPLASGAISVRRAILFTLALLLAGFVIVIQMNLVTILLGVVSLVFVGIYPLMKRITWWPQAFLGLTFNFGALMGWTAVTGVVGQPAILMYVAGIFWTLGYDTIYAHQDIEDDMKVGIKSTALRFGAHGKIWVARFYALCWLFMVAAFVTAGAGFVSCAVLALAGMQLRWQVRAWKMNDPASALRFFRSNRDFGWIVMMAAALSGLV